MIIYWILSSFKHIGDYNQALEIKKIVDSNPPCPIEVRLFDVEGSNEFTLDADRPNSYLHSVGEKGMYFMLDLKKKIDMQECIIIVQIHQHFPELLQLQPNFLLIPKASYRQCQQLAHTKKLLLQGTIFQKLSKEQLEQLYLTNPISKDIDLNEHHIIVMLGGDAPDQQTMNVFSKESSELLINRLIYFMGYHKGAPFKVIVQNGPRTGKHDPESKKESCLHTFKENEDPGQAVDEVSKYFTGRLAELKIPHLFYNFAFELLESGRKIHSFYKPLLHVAQSHQAMFFFPMESVSMCSELPYYIEQSRLFVYHTSSTNSDHQKIANNFFEKGLFNKFQENQFKFVINSNERNGTFNEIEELLAQIFPQKLELLSD